MQADGGGPKDHPHHTPYHIYKIEQLLEVIGVDKGHHQNPRIDGQPHWVWNNTYPAEITDQEKKKKYSFSRNERITVPIPQDLDVIGQIRRYTNRYDQKCLKANAATLRLHCTIH